MQRRPSFVRTLVSGSVVSALGLPGCMVDNDAIDVLEATGPAETDGGFDDADETQGWEPVPGQAMPPCADCDETPICGNGIVEGNEACDDGNLDEEDGCDITCQKPPSCEDGVLHPGEFCFASPVLLPTGAFPRALDLVDVTGDGHLDVLVVTAADDRVQWWEGDGTGGFAPAEPSSSGGEGPIAVATGDLDGDGQLDLAIAHESSRSVDVRWGTGSAVAPFGPPQRVAFDVSPRAVVIADVAGDAREELAFVVDPEAACHETVVVRFADTREPQPLDAGVAPCVEAGPSPAYASVVAFAWGEGATPVVLSTRIGEGVVLATKVDGMSTTTSQVAGVGEPQLRPAALAVGDFDEDGRPDLLAANYDPQSCNYDLDPQACAHDTVALLRGTDEEQVGTPEFAAVGRAPAAIAVGDLDADGHLDAVTADLVEWGPSVLLGNGVGGFHAMPRLETAGPGTVAVAVADLDGDGVDDVVTVEPFSDVVDVFLSVP